MTDETPETPAAPVPVPTEPPTAPTVEEPAPVPAPAETGYRPGEFPQVLYHRTQGSKTVQSVDERNALGAGWTDTPVSD
jgi:hypothetical protein